MKHFTQYVIKFILTIAFIFAISYALPADLTLNFWQLVIVSLVLSLLGYYGDILFMPKVGAFRTALLDIPFNFLILWLGHIILGYRANISGLIAASLAVALLEFINHLLIVDTRRARH